ncbi:MAG: [FeFe] hydrogenase H-cluster maturation GTPase HydF [bacterium]|nr:[FeFe] hydrogenase H-cluster maturation GTPase HydF [bacterium]
MELQNVPVSERTHIAFFGCRNAGKSSLVNAVTAQNLSVVSKIKGTTTDAVKKTMELLPLGPVVIIDTPGIDDEGELGNLRIEKTNETLNKTDIAVLTVDGTVGLGTADYELIERFKLKKIPYIIAYNKSDLIKTKNFHSGENEIFVSAVSGENIELLKESIAKLIKSEKNDKKIIADKMEAGEFVILVMPIDSSAPKGRLILPQQLTIRELLEAHCSVVCVQERELKSALDSLNTKIRIVITDSQVFGKVKNIVPKEVLLTSFSILFANYKGNLKELVLGAKKISELKNGSKILISEGCTHHRQCNDIGTVKMPKWLEDYTHVKLNYTFTSGGEFPKDLSKYDLVIHCGGCMLNEQEMISRINQACQQKVSIVNYGIAISYMNGILKRSLEIFPEISEILE